MLLSKKYIGLFGTLSLLFFVMSRASAQENTMTSMTRTEHDSYSVALPDRQQKALFALKTNALFDAALCLNAEIEVPIDRNNRWSIMAEFWKPWFVWKNNSRAYQIQVIGGEVRYWLGKDRSQRKQLTGWFGGLYYANGKYDLEWNSDGDQGEFNSVGATVGYSWSIHRRWNLELSASVSHLWGPRRHYEATDNGDYLLWQYTTNSTYTGPTKLKVSFVWLLGQRRQDKSRKEGLN